MIFLHTLTFYKKISLIFLFISYCAIGTGIQADDYLFVVDAIKGGFINNLKLWFSNKYSFLSAPNFLLQIVLSHLFKDNYIFYDIISIVIMCLSIYCIYRFSLIFMKPLNSIIFAICFIIYPIHETSNLQPITFYYLIVPALIMYGFYLIWNSKNLKGIIILFIGTFFSYGSLPYVFGLSYLLFKNKKLNKLIIFIFL